MLQSASRGGLLLGGSAPGGCLLLGGAWSMVQGGVCSRLAQSGPKKGASATLLGGFAPGGSAPGGCLLGGVPGPGGVSALRASLYPSMY